MKEMFHTFLFVPALRLDRIEKALSSEADAVIIDLEDAVSATDKKDARNLLANFNSERTAFVRINDASTEWFEEDISVISNCEWVEGIVLPKVESSAQVEELRSRVKRALPILAIIESSRGILNAREIAASGPSRLLFGSVDYTAELGSDPSEMLFLYPRTFLVLVSADARLDPPIDGPTTMLDDTERLTRECKAARALGMGGKICVHPRQLPIANAIFRNSSSDKSWAKKILDAHEESPDGVFVVDGEMIDSPVIQKARKILEI